MLFNSIDFAIFLPIVFVLYWFVTKNNLKLQNLLILISSYIFYSWWDWRFLSLIIISSLVDYIIGIYLGKNNKTYIRRLLLFSSIAANLGLLAFFKYYDFFLDSFIEAFKFFGYAVNVRGLEIVLPVGISFYTFQSLSYSIDIYRNKLKPTKDFVAFFAFVSFFPQLVAGPIERATKLLPQFYVERSFNYNQAIDGMRQILWGLAKKIIIADNCAIYVNEIFTNSNEYSGSTLLLGAILFSFQIYGDFSGYSDIAIGTSRLFGFNLSRNFAYPYFSKNIGEFWRRWHISLTSWFKDYLYIPLGGSRGTMWLTTRNVMIVFLVSGLWHGASWHFIVWGFVNAFLFLPFLYLQKNRLAPLSHTPARESCLRKVINLSKVGTTFLVVSLTWVFFRANDIPHAFTYLQTIFSTSLLSFPSVFPKNILIIILAFTILEWVRQRKLHPLQGLEKIAPAPLRWLIYYGLVVLIITFQQDSQEFIYFKF